MPVKFESIIDELVAVSGSSSKKPREKEDNFIRRLVRDVSKLDDEKWEELSDEAQDLTNTAIRAIKNKQDLPKFLDSKKDPEPETDEDKVVSDQDEPNIVESDVVKNNQPASSFSTKITDGTVTKKRRKRSGGGAALRSLICEKMINQGEKITLEEAYNTLIENLDGSYSRTTAMVVYYETIATVNLLTEMGALK